MGALTRRTWASRRLLPLLVCLAFSGLVPRPVWAVTAYTVAVEQQSTPVDSGQRWTPLLERLSRETGIPLQLRLPKSDQEFENEYRAGLPDLIFANPYHIVMARRTQAYEPFLRGDRLLRGMLLVDKRGQVRSMSDLHGKRVAFPASHAFPASLYLRGLLRAAERIDIEPDYVGSDRNVLRHVLLGTVAAGGAIDHSLERESRVVRDRFRVLYTTPAAPSQPIAAHPRVPRTVRERLAQALLRMHADPAGKRLLADADLDPPIRTEYDLEYAPIEVLLHAYLSEQSGGASAP